MNLLPFSSFLEFAHLLSLSSLPSLSLSSPLYLSLSLQYSFLVLSYTAAASLPHLSPSQTRLFLTRSICASLHNVTLNTTKS